ncbi:tissue inhibitor of metalloproteinase [Ostertagia ostertagi]
MRAVLILVACIVASEACTCFPFPSLRDAFCYSSFVAHVRAAGRINDTDSQTVRYNVVYLETYRALGYIEICPDGSADFKNQTESRQLPTEIVTGSTSALCGIELRIGTEYLIGGSIEENGELYSDLCGLLQEWSSVSATNRSALKTYRC